MAVQTTNVSPPMNGRAVKPKSRLSISLARYLHGHDVATYLDNDWSSKATASQRQRFDNQGFDPTHPEDTLAALKDILQGRDWDGVIVGWCTRGNKAFTALFECVVDVLAKELVRRETKGEGGLKLMFSEGPEDLMRTTLRTFGSEDEQL